MATKKIEKNIGNLTPAQQKILAEMDGKMFISASNTKPPEFIPTGFHELDTQVLRHINPQGESIAGGLPRGRTIEFFADPSCGKTSLALNLIANAQKEGLLCGWFPVEEFDRDYAASIGVNLEELKIFEFTDATDLLHKALMALAYDLFDILVLDSLNAMTVDVRDKNIRKMDKGTGAEGRRGTVVQPEKMNDAMLRGKVLQRFWRSIQSGFKIKGPDGDFIRLDTPIWYCPDGSVKMEESWVHHRLVNKKCCFIFINHRLDPMETYAQVDSSGGKGKNFAFSARMELRSPKSDVKIQTVKGVKELKHRDVTILVHKTKIGIGGGEAKLRLLQNGRFCSLTAEDIAESKKSEALETGGETSTIEDIFDNV